MSKKLLLILVALAAGVGAYLLIPPHFNHGGIGPLDSDSSPIIISDGSVHIRHKKKITPGGDARHASIDISKHDSEDIVISNCAPGHSSDMSDCKRSSDAQPPQAGLVGKVWTLTVMDKAGQTVATLTNDTQDHATVSLTSAYDLAPENSNGSDPAGLVECADDSCRLGAAVLEVRGGNKYTMDCPTDDQDGRKCTIRVRYCSGGSCK
jgi:hypothetical protein